MPAVRFARFMREILDLYRPPHRRSSTHAKMRKALEELAELGARRTSDVGPSLLVRWCAAHSDRRPATNRSYLGSLRAACAIAKQLGYLRVSPFEVRRDWIAQDVDDDTEAIARRHLTVGEVVAVLDQADAEAIMGDWRAGRLQALVYTYAFAGLRKAEALGLALEDVHLDQRCIRLRGRRNRRLKTRSSWRPVAIHPELAVVLQRWILRTGSEWLFPGIRREGPWLNGPAGDKALDHVKALADRAGVPGVTIQAFRRSLATHARRFGLGSREVRDLLRHSDERTQEWYLEDDIEDQLVAVSKIDYRAAAGRPA